MVTWHIPQHLGRTTVILTALILATGPGHARPPENPDPRLAPWFESLIAPGSSIPCCSISDCRRTAERTRNGHYEVQIEGKWIVVPDDTILYGIANLTGEAVVCWSPVMGIMCFIRAPEI